MACTPQDLENLLEQVRTDQKSLSDQLRLARNPAALMRPAKSVIDALAGTEGGREKGPFKTFSHFLRDVHIKSTKNAYSRELERWAKTAPLGMGETVSTDGGFLVPPAFSNTLLQRAYENDLLSRTTMFPMSGSNQLKIPAIDETSRVDGSRFGGIQAYWRGEGGSVTNTQPKIAQVTLTLNSLMLTARITEELMDDSGVALQTFLDNIANQELQFKIGDGIVNGDGVDKPLGILNSDAKVTVTKEPSQLTKTIVMENIVRMYARMYAPCRKNAVWLINQDVEPMLFTLALNVGTGGLPVYLPPGGLSVAPYGTLFNRPVLPVEFCQTLGTEGDIILWDPSAYLTGTKGSVQSAVSMHVYFLTNEESFRFVFRMDGKPWWLKALTPFKGTNTQSCIVTLQTR